MKNIQDFDVLLARTSSLYSNLLKSKEEEEVISASASASLPSLTNISDTKLLVLENALDKADMLSQVMDWQVPLLDAAREGEKALSFHQFESSLLALAVSDIKLTLPQRQLLLSSSLHAALPEFLSNSYEDKELWERIANYIGIINVEYLLVYEKGLTNYTGLFSDFVNSIMSHMKEWIKEGGDSSHVKINVGDFNKAVKELISRYQLPNKGGILFPPQDGKGTVLKGASEDEAKKWASDMGMDPSCVKKLPDGSFVVVVDLGPLSAMLIESGGTGWETWDNAKFQAWQTNFNAQQEQLKNKMQTLAQKYSTANSIFDNLIKILSSTISSCLETAKSFLQR